LLLVLGALSCLLLFLIVQRMVYFNDVFFASVWIAILLSAYVLVYFVF
jgi:hypothetical protein